MILIFYILNILDSNKMLNYINNKKILARDPNVTPFDLYVVTLRCSKFGIEELNKKFKIRYKL